MINFEKCLEIGLPAPGKAEDQVHYITRIIAEGYNVNTRTCPQIGICNLRYIALKLWGIGTDFGRVECPLWNDVHHETVLFIYMTLEQQRTYWRSKRKPIKEATQ